jgi:integrase
LFQDTLVEYGWARDVAVLAASTLQQVIAPVVELCTHYGCAPWQLTPRNLDQYFAGPGKRGHSTIRAKLVHLDGYFAFLEQRYAGEILRRFGIAVESPVDRFNRPHHRGDFGIRIPPSRRAMREFFGSWRDDLGNARKYPIAVRDYVMTKIAYLSGVRAAELCGVRITDVHWENGQWGRFLVRGKGALPLLMINPSGAPSATNPPTTPRHDRTRAADPVARADHYHRTDHDVAEGQRGRRLPLLPQLGRRRPARAVHDMRGMESQRLQRRPLPPLRVPGGDQHQRCVLPLPAGDTRHRPRVVLRIPPRSTSPLDWGAIEHQTV